MLMERRGTANDKLQWPGVREVALATPHPSPGR